MRAFAAGVLTIAYIIVLAIVYVIHVWFFNVDVVFYSAILDAMISCAILAALSLFIRARLPIDGFSLIPPVRQDVRIVDIGPRHNYTFGSNGTVEVVL